MLRSAELTLQQGYTSFTLAPPGSEAILLQGGNVQAVAPGPDRLVRMSRRPADGGVANYDARRVCDQLGAY
ncbi:hypothetical protein [Duganella callida]|uniref:Uncharacterized protein n=1 Tax=Duganella callida TaxID=2561932 RepID=A0A4Y9RZR7_9BURK|nr:hypothetical protein [Duganella callida]TFW13266.1 hypothetical protein E4L98_29415 [Duganella callida]